MSEAQPTDVKAVLRSAASKLGEQNLSPFSPAAFVALKENIDEYIGDLVEESIKLARRHRSEFVSVNYVMHASEYLIASRSRRFGRHVGTVGGALLGASLSNVLAMAQTGNSFPVLGTVISVGLAVLGAFLIAFHIAKD